MEKSSHYVYQVSAHEQETGTVWVPVTQVVATSDASARNRAVALLVAAVNEYNEEAIGDDQVSLEDVLDVTLVTVRPF